MSRLPAALAVVASLTIGPVDAGESDTAAMLYESTDGIVLGRVFLSPAERAALEARRRRSVQQTGTDTEARSAEPAASAGLRPEGYIRVSGKAPAVYEDGRFVSSPVSSPDDTHVDRGTARKVPPAANRRDRDRSTDREP